MKSLLSNNLSKKWTRAEAVPLGWRVEEEYEKG